MTRRGWAARLRKEIRALLPTWLATAAAVVAAAVSGMPALLALGVLAFGFGAVTLGAQSIGHEFTHRTLGTLLALPLDRRRALLDKSLVLGLMLAALSALSLVAVLRATGWRGPATPAMPLWIAGVLGCALFVAPWFTMVCRSTLAGAVFTVAVPASLSLLGDALAVAMSGGDEAVVEQVESVIRGAGLVGLCGLGAFWTWRLFMRLEAIEGEASGVALPAWVRGFNAAGHAAELPAHQRRRPVWLLIGKELRLQQMTFLVVAMFLAAWTILWLQQRNAPAGSTLQLGALTTLFFGLLAVLIGALASAEERQHGTLEWQLLLPMAASRQWAVKVAVVIGLVMALTFSVPWILSLIDPPSRAAMPRTGVLTEVGAIVLLLACGSLYVSSLSSSGVRALVCAFPVLLGAQLVLAFIARSVRELLAGPVAGVPFVARMGQPAWTRTILSTLFVAFALGGAALLVRFAFVNHRSADRPVRRLIAQAAWLLGLATAGMVSLQLAVNALPR